VPYRSRCGRRGEDRPEPLIRLLTDDAVSEADGGGRIPVRKTPITGAFGIARFPRGLFQPTDAKRAIIGGNPVFHAVVVNGGPSMLVEVGEQVIGFICLNVTPTASRRSISRSTRQT
jgi:RNA polymerase sigma-70 factor (ECF subfamily)